MQSLLNRICGFILLGILVVFSASAGSPELPFTEDFSSDNLIDKTKTTADINAEEQAVRLAWKKKQYGAFVDPPSCDISSDEGETHAIATGDGDVDIVVGNDGVNKLYLNNGLKSVPFADVVGSPITNDSDNSLSITLGDVDGDGDLDVVAGNWRASNRLYLNNGTEDPFTAVNGLNISGDTDDAESIVL